MLLNCARWHGGYKEEYNVITSLKDLWSMDGHEERIKKKMEKGSVHGIGIWKMRDFSLSLWRGY